MSEHNTPEALVDGDHDMPTEAEIQAMREEAENFRLPAPPPTPVRGRFYLTECEHCGWVGSSEHCGGWAGPDDDDVVCPVCCSSICGDAPDETDTAKHGEAVYQRIVTAEAERDAALAALQQVTAERDEAREAVARCNNSFGSYSYHLNPHPAEQIEKVKWQARSEWQRAEAAEASLATANAELARLRAEGEAKDRAVLLLLPFVDYAAGEGLMFVETEDGEHPEMDAADIMTFAAQALGLELGSDAYLALLPAGYDAIRAARAATAREGQADDA